MKLNSQFFQSRYWQPGLILGSLIFLILTIFLGYRLWKNSQDDLTNVQNIREFKAASANALFFSTKVVTGDSSAIDPLVVTFKSLDERLGEMQNVDDYTKDRLNEEFSQINGLWRNLKQNADVTSEIEFSVNLVNALRSHLDRAASEADLLFSESIEELTLAKAPEYQVNRIKRLEQLIRAMVNDIDRFKTEIKPDRSQVEKLQADVRSYEEDYNILMFGLNEGNLRPVTNPNVRTRLEQVNSLVEAISSSSSDSKPFYPSIEKILLAREAGQGIQTSFGSLQSILSEMEEKINNFSQDRFPKLYHVITSAVLLFACIILLILQQRVTARKELAKEHEESQRTQAAILRLLDELVDLADGDLTISATVSEDFTGAIADSINFTIDQLRQLVSRINSTAVEVSQAAQSTQQTALHLAEASDHQAQEIAGASAAINEMAVTIDQVSANASESALVAGKSVSIANNGAKLVQNTIHGMDTIREQIQDTSKRIKRLGESSQEIGDIVSLINDIADQTNILALNAAIQASMAGDAGRGFAVVADEVQRLAERSAAATKQIETIVKTIQTDTNEAVISMEQTTSEVVNGARLAQDAGVALEEIEGVSASLAELIQNISNAARQQASSAGHISNTMNVIQEITSQTSSGTNATAQSIGDLANMALELRESVAGFTLPPEMIADLEQHGSANSDSEPKAQPTAAASASKQVTNGSSNNIDELIDDLDVSEEDMEQAGEFFELLAGDESDDDLLSEFDVDLSDVELPDDDKKLIG
jgi:twitching motility protein PilJ